MSAPPICRPDSNRPPRWSCKHKRPGSWLTFGAWLGLAGLGLTIPSAAVADDGLPSLPVEAWQQPDEHFDGWQDLIRPQPGESHWLQVPWRTSLWQARREAAAQGKPIFIWAGSGGGPVGVC